MKRILPLLATLFVLCGHLTAADAPLCLKTETFDRDPGWDNSSNRVVASDPPTVTQDFGWSPGKIGGTIWKSTTPAWYGMPLKQPLSFKDAFSASGKITAVKPETGRGGVAYLGFFNHERQGWRAWNSMAMRVANDDKEALIFLDYSTALWNAGAAEMELGIPMDGSEHTWRFTYDPNATRAPWTDTRLRSYLTTARQLATDVLAKAKPAEPELTLAALQGRLRAALELGLVTFLNRGGKEWWLLKQDKEDLKGAVSVQIDGGETFRTYLPAAVRDQPVVMDRFGIFNMQTYHGSVKFHVADLMVNGAKIDLSKDPGWDGVGNRTTFVERDFQRQDFGYSADTKFAGGAKGEIGGEFYNVEPLDPLHGFYADEVGQLTLDDPIRFSGKIYFHEATADAGMYFGYFRKEDELRELGKNQPGNASGWPQPNTLGVVVDGPARIGWWFIPVVTAADRKLSGKTQDHVFLPTRKSRTFDFQYDPAANNGVGRITVTLDAEPPFTLDLTPEQRKSGATFDRFGLMSFRRGGHNSTLYFDDLTYTTRRAADAPPLRHEQKIITVPYPPSGRKY